MKSEIFGKGHGDAHTWKRMKVFEHKDKEERNTWFTCSICNEQFYHYYHNIKDIFLAMKVNGINAMCERHSHEEV